MVRPFAVMPAPSDTAAETWLFSPLAPTDRVAEPVQVLWAYPASYSVSMSALGYLLLFQVMAQCPHAEPYRITQDTANTLPIRVDQADLLGFSISWELDCFTLLPMLDTMGIPHPAAERRRHGGYPLLFAGGPVITSNPEPYADWFDFFLIGDGEEVFPEVMRFAWEHRTLRQEDPDRFLLLLAQQVRGVYVPSLYTVTYHEDGPVASITPVADGVPFPVEKRNTDLSGGDRIVTSPVLTEDTIFSNTFLVEVMRGCAHRCRFCLASYSVLPARGPTFGALKAAVERGLTHTRKIGLLGALIANHPEFDELCTFLQAQDDVTISSASLRADTLSPHVVKTFAHGKQRQLTIAVESGSERLRRRINKNLTEPEILHAASTVYDNGVPGLKLYGMVGLPDEDEADVAALGELMLKLRKHTPRLRLTLGVSSFVPKAATPFQWQPRLETAELKRRVDLLRRTLKGGVEFHPSSPRWDFLQALVSRGDRRLGRLLSLMQRLGGQPGHVRQAWRLLREEARGGRGPDTAGGDGSRPDVPLLPDPDWVVLRQIPQDETLPWEVLFLGVPKPILYKEGLAPPSTQRPA